LEKIEERGPDGRLFYYQRMAYDAEDRMTRRLVLPAPGAWSEPADTASFDGDNWMTAFNGATLSHDADGNLLAAPTRPAGAGSGAADGGSSFVWDARNRVVSSSSTGFQAVFMTYSPDGHLTHLRTGSATANVGTRFTVNPDGSGGLSQVLVRTDLATNAKTKVIHGVGTLYERLPDGTMRWHHHDHLGSTVALSNDTGVVTGRAAYSVYGMTYSLSGDMGNTPFLYNGLFGVLTEASSGCLHMRARWYNPRLRRFLSSDPIGFEGGWNMFAYANGDPVMKNDPSGNWTAGAGLYAEFDIVWQFHFDVQPSFTANGWNPLDWRVGGFANVVPGLTAAVTNAGVSGGVTGTLSPSATSASQLSGWSNAVGVAVSPASNIIPAEITASVWNLPNGPTAYSVGLGLSGSLLPASVSFAHGRTFAGDFSPREVFNWIGDKASNAWDWATGFFSSPSPPISQKVMPSAPPSGVGRYSTQTIGRK
jgi:RHS repeat-associated protein